MNIPAHLKYTKTDEWYDPGTGALGLTDYAQSQLSDLVFVEIHVEPGDALEPGTAIASVESVKASAETYSPVGGKVAEVNKALSEKPEIMNSDPYGQAWMIKVAEAVAASDLMDAAAYERYCAERTH